MGEKEERGMGRISLPWKFLTGGVRWRDYKRCSLQGPLEKMKIGDIVEVWHIPKSYPVDLWMHLCIQFLRRDFPERAFEISKERGVSSTTPNLKVAWQVNIRRTK